jgi:peptidoglycan hydrolase-like protein with peptidoglycan-binding domain
MNRALKLSLIGAGVVGGGLLIYYLVRRWNDNRTIKNAGNNDADRPNVVTTPKPKGDDKLPLKNGSYGEKVKLVQDGLVKKYGYDLGTTGPNKDGVDGDFGPLTEAAVRKLQARQDYLTNYGALSNGAFKFGEVDAVTYLLIVGKAY